LQEFLNLIYVCAFYILIGNTKEILRDWCGSLYRPLFGFGPYEGDDEILRYQVVVEDNKFGLLNQA
jgi:hypothetical protein